MQLGVNILSSILDILHNHPQLLPNLHRKRKKTKVEGVQLGKIRVLKMATLEDMALTGTDYLKEETLSLLVSLE